MKNYQEVQADLITMLEDLNKNLTHVFEEEELFENRVNKESIEIEKYLLSDKRFLIKTKK